MHSALVRINDGQALLRYVPELGRSPFPKILLNYCDYKSFANLMIGAWRE